MAETATATSADQASSDASGAVAAPVRTCARGTHLTPGGGECEPCRKAREATLQRSALSSAAATRAVPSIVGDVLATSGRPLDATTRRPHEQRFARDFSHVRVHADARAAQSARAVDARADPVGSHIAFGAGEFAPDTPAGAGLLGHELTHVVQQQRGTAGEAHELRVVEDPALERDADRQAVGEGRTSPPVALQRASKPGWTGSPASSLNVGQTAVGSIRRLPIENLTEGNQEDVSGAAESTKGRAIVLLHTTFDATKRADVLIHFHGHNVGYRESGGVHRDRDVYRIEQQIEASKKAQLIGVLPQGTPGSWFGASGAGKAREKSFSSDAYLRDVFAKLKSVGVWSAPPPIGNVMISGHSGAGELINEKLLGGAPTSSLPSAVGRLAEVALFDGVNGPNEFLALEKWLEGQLNADRAKVAGLPDRAARLAYLQTSMRFRAYFTDNAYYSKWHIGPLPAGDKRLAGKKPLAQFVVGWFAANAAALGGTSSAEFKALRRNYDVVQVGHPDHEQVMAQRKR